MKKQILTFALLTASVAATAQVTEQKPYWAQSDTLCAKLMTMDTHNHIDVPMMTENMPGPRVDLRTAMKKAGISAIGMTFAVDYVQPLKEGQEYERFVNAMTAQDSILRWSGLRLTLSAKEMIQRFEAGEPLVILVDLAHCDSTTIAQALEVATRPVQISHTGLSTRLGSNEFMGKMMRPRLITPAQARMVAAKGGVIGIWPHLASSPEEYASNIRAMVDIVGIDHVCIGTDSKITPEYQEMTDEMRERFQKEQDKREAERKAKGEQEGPRPQFQPRNPNAANHEWGQEPDNFYHSVIRCLLAEGFNAGEIEKIVSGNFLRVFSEATK